MTIALLFPQTTVSKIFEECNINTLLHFSDNAMLLGKLLCFIHICGVVIGLTYSN